MSFPSVALVPLDHDHVVCSQMQKRKTVSAIQYVSLRPWVEIKLRTMKGGLNKPVNFAPKTRFSGFSSELGVPILDILSLVGSISWHLVVEAACGAALWFLTHWRATNGVDFTTDRYSRIVIFCSTALSCVKWRERGKGEMVVKVI